LIFNVLLSNLAPVLIMPLFNKYVPLGDEHKDLAERLLNLAERAHTKVRGVFKFDMSRRTKSANAALTGLYPPHRARRHTPQRVHDRRNRDGPGA
jgi:STE24 endopeptidase